MSYETKALPIAELKFSDSGNGSFAGYASTFGTIDAYGDIVEKGAYKATLPQFLRDGFIAWSHDYASLPIAMPTSAKEDGKGLWVEAQFHADEFAQRARRIAAERAAAGKSVGLSIGYAATSFGHDDAGHRLLKAVDLYETSLVMLPANREAGILGIKSVPAPELKPYGIRKDGDRYCVYNTETDETEKCHPTRAEALAHQRALMANVSDADKAAPRAGWHFSKDPQSATHADPEKVAPTAFPFDFDVSFTGLLKQLGEVTEYGAQEAEALLARRAAEERKLSPEHSAAIRDYLVTAEATRERLERLLLQPASGKPGVKAIWELRRLRLRAMETD
jgi:HK97 family phage prohead protease